MKLENLDLKRLTVHKIYGKSKTNDIPYAGECKELSKLGADGMDILHKRIDSCLNHKSKFYELSLQDKTADSFFEIQKPLLGSNKTTFLNIAQQIADKAAEAHSTANIPDGLLLLIEASITGMNTIIAVKAEMSNAFSLANNDLQLIKDIFLSSDKTLYKVGFFLKSDSFGNDAKSYRYFVYDDSFSPSKGDLAYYFYSKFLGLTTEKNSKLLTNNLHRTLMDFTQDHIDVGDKYEVMRTIDRAFLNPKTKSVNATDFKSFFPSELEQLYESTVEVDFPNSFIKDNSIVNSINTKRITITDETTLLLKNAPEGIITGSTRIPKDATKLKVSIDSGRPYHYALIPSDSIKDLTKNPNEPPKRKRDNQKEANVRLFPD
jgi:hypothetical protein